MDMKRLISRLAILSILISTNANAGFLFLPGNVTGKIADTITGSEGENCVGPNAKVGDTYRSVNGNIQTIKSLSGTSSRCVKPEQPIRARIEYTNSTTFLSKAGINIPDGFAPQNLTDLQKFNGGLLMAKNNVTDSGFYVSSVKRDVVSDLDAYSLKVRTNQAKPLDEPQQSEIEQLTINGIAAWRFETKGKVKNIFGTRYTYLTTILEGANEILILNAWTKTGNYEKQPEELKALAKSISGLEAPILKDGVIASTLQSDTLSAINIKENASNNVSTVGLTKPVDIPTVETPKVVSLAQSELAPIAPVPEIILPGNEILVKKLRDLNALFKDGVITQGEFEIKKQEILKLM